MIGITHLPQYVLLLVVPCHQQDSKDACAGVCTSIVVHCSPCSVLFSSDVAGLLMKKGITYQCFWQAVAAGKQRLMAEQWHQAQLLRAVVLAWEGHTCYKIDRQRLHRKAVRHRSML